MFSKLPNELKFNILDFVSIKELLRFSILCKKDNELAKSDIPWRSVLKNDFKLSDEVLIQWISKEQKSYKTLYQIIYNVMKTHKEIRSCVGNNYPSLLAKLGFDQTMWQRFFLDRYIDCNKNEYERKTNNKLVFPTEEETPSIGYLDLSLRGTLAEVGEPNVGPGIGDLPSLFARFTYLTGDMVNINFEKFINQEEQVLETQMESIYKFDGFFCNVINTDNINILKNTVDLINFRGEYTSFVNSMLLGKVHCGVYISPDFPKTYAPEDVKKWQESHPISQEAAFIVYKEHIYLFIKSMNMVCDIESEDLTPLQSILFNNSSTKLSENKFVCLLDKLSISQQKSLLGLSPDTEVTPYKFYCPPCILIANESCYNEIIERLDEIKLTISCVLKGDFDLRQLETKLGRKFSMEDLVSLKDDPINAEVLKHISLLVAEARSYYLANMNNRNSLNLEEESEDTKGWRGNCSLI